MISHPHALDHLKARVADAIAEESTRVSKGGASDWPDYRHRVGILTGLRKLDDFITELTEDKERK